MKKIISITSDTAFLLSHITQLIWSMALPLFLSACIAILFLNGCHKLAVSLEKYSGEVVKIKHK